MIESSPLKKPRPPPPQPIYYDEAGLSRKERKREKNKARLTASQTSQGCVTTIQAEEGFNIASDVQITKTGWRGLHVPVAERRWLIAHTSEMLDMVRAMQRVPFRKPARYISLHYPSHLLTFAGNYLN